MFIVTDLEVNNSYAWASLRNPQLKDLAVKLPEILLASHAPKTNSAYDYAFQRWRNWCVSNNVAAVPASPIFIALFMVHIGEKTASASAVKLILPALTWAHTLQGVDFEGDTALTRGVSAGLQRSFAKPRKPKEPISAHHLLQVASVTNINSLDDVRTMVLMLLSFAGFLRFDELANLRVSDISMFQSHINVKIRRSKTDQLRNGDELVIAATGTACCPMLWIKHYFELAKLNKTSEDFMFRALYRLKNGKAGLRANNVPISYTRAREVVLKRLTDIGLDKSSYGLHSF